MPHAIGQTEYLSPDSHFLISTINNPTTLLHPRPVFCPAPRISITPEVSAIEAGHSVFWVAIEVSATPWYAPEKATQPGAR